MAGLMFASPTEIFVEIVRRLEAGEPLQLCVVTQTHGSAPQVAGAKMLVFGNGKTLGTLGGGCVEAEVRRRALELSAAARTEALRFNLNHDYGWDDGLICGGVMHILAYHLTAVDLDHFRTVRAGLLSKRPVEFRLAYLEDRQRKQYSENISPAPLLLIAGAGHVGAALAALAGKLDFRVAVVDDRADLLSSAPFAAAGQRLVGEIEEQLAHFPIDGSTYIVIVTRGHRHDGRALKAVIGSGARYIGLIGSKAKIKLIFRELSSQGVSAEKLSIVHAPVGLSIGAVTPPEIALSIAAELVAIRRGACPEMAAGHLKMNASELVAWLKP